MPEDKKSETAEKPETAEKTEKAKKAAEYKPHVYKYPPTEQARSDMPMVFFGLLVFVGLMLAATVGNRVLHKFKQKPVLELPKHEKNCVRDVQFMRENHMKLLNDWRDQVVRTGVRFEQIPRRDDHGKVLKDGQGKIVHQKIERSLTKTCLRCHDNPRAFCDRCHEYAGVTKKGGLLGCFSCHIQPNPKPARR